MDQFFSPPGLLQHVLIPALCSRLLDGCFPLLPSSIWASSSIPTFLSCSHAFSSSPACVLFLFGQCFFKVLHREHHSSFFAHGCSSFAPLIIMLPLHSISAGSRTCCCISTHHALHSSQSDSSSLPCWTVEMQPLHVCWTKLLQGRVSWIFCWTSV
ncbi:hypothetical protein LR48_Vigan590s000200 [Vigna angularis]|uniref:Uncharacterized protein n=2 Tax=Phaseolus angularis TaxID=3914 RepID=A0A0L9TE72_PHAAN|nr:hypothetical protein LR48_Vigan590s000200 [Vigna angularis]BAU03280.1 hypothetical protein VIGAN_UM065200 [Vigna angularis var. angularis]